MRNFFLALSCCSAVLTTGCALSIGPLTGMPEKSSFGYNLTVAGESRAIRAEALQQARVFCEKENKQYVLNRHAFRVDSRSGSPFYTYELYFQCVDDQTAKAAGPEKVQAQKSKVVVRQKAPPSEKAVVQPEEQTAAKETGKEQPRKNGKQPAVAVKEQRKEAPVVVLPEELPAAAAKKDEPPPEKMQVASAPVAVRKRVAAKKEYVPGEVERLAPPGEEEPAILDSNFTEETLEE